MELVLKLIFCAATWYAVGLGTMFWVMNNPNYTKIYTREVYTLGMLGFVVTFYFIYLEFKYRITGK
jgi:hypothetical protein